MNGKRLKRLALDFFMLALILVEFAYELTGNRVHELIGIGMFTLFLVHGGLNWQWFRTLLKGRYNTLRITGVTVNALLLSAAFVLIFSGLLNSDLQFSLTGIEFDLLSREIHTAAAHWLLILMAVHLGLHWKMVMAEARSLAGVAQTSRFGSLALKFTSALMAVAGVHASFERGMLGKLTAYYSFDYWDFDASVLGFFVQYLAIVGLYACLAYYTLPLLKRRSRSLRRLGLNGLYTISGCDKCKCGTRV